MEQIQFDVQLRKLSGTAGAQRVRRADLIPAIVYGGKDKPTMISADRKTYERIHRQHVGVSLIYHINVMDEGKKIADFPAIVKDLQQHPISDEVIHLDFNRISLDQEIEVKVQIVTKGEAIGIKRDGGVLDHTMWELDIICLPKNIPHHIEVDVTDLGVHDSLHVRDLILPEGVHTKHDMDAVIVSVIGAMKEELSVVEGEGAPAELEVLKEKKKDEADSPDAKKAEGKKDDKK